MKHFFTFVLAVLLPIFSSYAQTAKWCIKPKYSEITLFGEDLFKCVDRTGKVQLIDRNGKELLQSVDADAVTNFSDGYALVLKGKKILGLFSEQGHQFTAVRGEYYTTEYPFFSEGFLAVADSKGKMGYLDERGNLAIQCKFVVARPFMQGWASVEKKAKEVWYITPQGKEMRPDGFHGGKLTKGSSFNENGEAVVANYQDYAVIKTNMQVKKKIAYTSDLPVRPCDYAYSEDAKECEEGVDYPMEEDTRIEAYSDNGSYGYRLKNEKDKIVLPAQFSEAKPFYSKYSIVKKEGGYGVLELLDGNLIANWPKESFRVYPDGKCNRLHFELVAPYSLESGKIELELDDGNGKFNKNVPLAYDIEPDFYRGTNQCIISGKASYDGLMLWQESKVIEVDEITVDVKSPYTTSKYADENGNQTVKTVVTNTSDVDVMVEATLKVSDQTTHFKQTLKPKQSKTLSIAVKVTEDKDVQAVVSVKSDGHNCGSKTLILSLKTV